MATSDRYFIEHYRTTREVGIYAINYGLWSVPYLSLNAWLEVLVRSRMFERAEKKDWKGVRRLALVRLGLALGIGSVVTCVILAVGKQVAVAIIGIHYWHSYELMVV